MSFEGLLHWLEKKSHGKHVQPAMTAVEHPADGTWSPEITSEGGVKLPPISGGVPVGE
jgi:hypothetical protein